MPFDSNGNASLVPSYFVQDGDDVLPVQHNPPFEDVASMLSQTLLRDGRAPLSGNLNANGNKVTNLAAPTNPNDAARLVDLTFGEPKITIYSTAGSFTHAFDSSTKRFQVEGCGAGGAGSGTTSGSTSSGDSHYGHGGHSGWHFETDVLDRGSITSATLVVGAGGTSNAASNAKTNGGNTTYDDGTNSFTWDGGLSPLAIGSGNIGAQMYQYDQPTTPASASARFGRGRFGTRGIVWTGTDSLGSGYGGDSPYGKGGVPVAANSAGNAGTGNGSGGSGSAKNSGSSSYNGGAGRPGIIIIKEWS